MQPESQREQYYENGERRPRNHAIVEKLASALNTTSEDLLGVSGNYVIEAQEKGGAKASRDIESLVDEVVGLFAGGSMDEAAMDGVYRNKEKYTPKKYRK